MIEEHVVLQVKNLGVAFGNNSPAVISGLDLTLFRGEILGLVGESGSGKTLLAKTVLRLDKNAVITSGDIVVEGESIVQCSEKTMRQLRGSSISMAMQDPAEAFDPLFTVGTQLFEALSVGEVMVKGAVDRKRIREQIINLFAEAGIDAPHARYRQYPHQWSKGMLQRAQLLMTMAQKPKIAILDEVISALDPTIALQILDLIRRMRRKFGSSILFITHNLGAAKEICDRIAVINGGTVIEVGNAEDIFSKPQKEYTGQLVSMYRGNDY